MSNCKSLYLACLIALVSLPLLGATNQASAQNLILNPDFETGDLTGWLVFGQSPSSMVTVSGSDNGPSAPGTKAAYLNNNAEAIALTLKQSTPAGSATAGAVQYSFDLKTGGAGLGGVFFVEIFAEQAGGGVIAASGVLGNYTPANWTTYSGSMNAPAGTDFLTIQLSAITGAVVGGYSRMYVDNVVLEQQGIVANDQASWSTLKALYR